jgi:hypothetical protein
MDPVTGSLMALQLGGGLIEMFGQKKQGQQASAAGLYNAGIYDQQAALIRQAAGVERETARRHKASYLSTMKTNYAFRGVKMNGSPLRVMADTAANLEQDIQTTEFNALTRASFSSSAAALERMSARNARMAGATSAGVTLINTGVKAINYLPKEKKPTAYGRE